MESGKFMQYTDNAMTFEQRLQQLLSETAEPATTQEPQPTVLSREQVAAYLKRRQHDWNSDHLLADQYTETTVDPMRLDLPGDATYSNPLGGEREVDPDYVKYLISIGNNPDPVVLDLQDRIVDGVHRITAAQQLHHRAHPALVPVQPENTDLDEMTFKLCEDTDAVRVVQRRLKKLDRRDHDTVDRIVQQVAKDRGLDARRLHELWAEADGIAGGAWRG